MNEKNNKILSKEKERARGESGDNKVDRIRNWTSQKSSSSFLRVVPPPPKGDVGPVLIFLKQKW